MHYQGYLIANNATGLDKQLQPWLNPDDSQDELLDGYVYRGVWQKRQGYTQFATGQQDGSAYCESRMVNRWKNINMQGVIDSSNKIFNISDVTVPAVIPPIRRGTITITASVPNQAFTDNGLGKFITVPLAISAITNANPGAVTTVLPHGYTTGSSLLITNATGMTEINSATTPYIITVTGANTFTVGIDTSNPLLYGTYSGSGTVSRIVGNVNYTTGTIGITTPIAPTAGTVKITYDSHQGLPVMGVMNYYKQDGNRELIVADTKYVNRLNLVTNQLDDITNTSLFMTGGNSNFLSWVNYADANSNNRLIWVNFKDGLQQYNGGAFPTAYPIYTTSVAITAEAHGTGNGSVGPYTINTPGVSGIVPGTLIITAGAQVVKDDQFGNLQNDGTGTVNYLTGTIVVSFTAIVAGATPITIDYKQMNTPIETALHISEFKDRMVVEYTIEGGKHYGRRFRISGTGAFCDIFTTDAIGAGVIDVPADTYISSSDFNRDDRIICLRDESWIMKYTGNDVVPFVLNRIDGSRGSDAPFGTITYLNRTNAISTLGMILTDGYSVQRSDDKLPNFARDDIDSDNFNLCFAGSVDKDRDHYLIYPTMGQTKSDRILVTNYEEDNFAIYRIPLSCMGNYIVSFDVTWNDLLKYNTWDELATDYGNWNAFAFSKGAELSIGGGHEGQITRLNDVETEDYPVKIRDITVIDSKNIQVITDFQAYELGSMIALEAVSGMTEVNNQQYELVLAVDNYTLNLQLDSTQDATTFGTYTTGGTASKCIEFSSKSKKFNPFANIDKKVACGWLYFYVSTTGTDLMDNQNILRVDKTNPCNIYEPGHGYQTGTQVYINGILGTTQLNNQSYYITKVDNDNFTLDGIDASGYTDYVSGGFSATPRDAILQVNCITNDNPEITQVQPFNPTPYQVNLTSQSASNGIKKWYKMWINQVARFIQFQVINNQSGSLIEIQAMMPGFAATGRMI